MLVNLQDHINRIKEYKDGRNTEQHPVLSKDKLRLALQETFADNNANLQSFLIFLNILPISEAVVERLL
jgi:hypothetical protein